MIILKQDIKDCRLSAVTNPLNKSNRKTKTNRQFIMILPGGGVRSHNAKAFLSQKLVTELHASCRGPNSTIDIEELKTLKEEMLKTD